MTPNPNPSPELLPCPFCGGEASLTVPSELVTADCADIYVACDECESEGQRIVVEIRDRGNDIWSEDCAEARRAWNTRALPPPTPAETVTVALPGAGEVESLRQALRNIAEGNLGDQPWQANYARIKEVATEALATQTATAEPFGYWIEQRLAEPVLLRKPSYIPEPSDLRTVTPLYASPTLATVAAANDEGVVRGIEAAAKVAENLCADMTVEANTEPHGLTSTLHRASAQAAGKIAAAIRLLSQGAGK